jgi:hypothetical protein
MACPATTSAEFCLPACTQLFALLLNQHNFLYLSLKTATIKKAESHRPGLLPEGVEPTAEKLKQ